MFTGNVRENSTPKYYLIIIKSDLQSLKIKMNVISGISKLFFQKRFWQDPSTEPLARLDSQTKLPRPS